MGLRRNHLLGLRQWSPVKDLQHDRWANGGLGPQGRCTGRSSLSGVVTAGASTMSVQYTCSLCA